LQIAFAGRARQIGVMPEPHEPRPFARQIEHRNAAFVAWYQRLAASRHMSVSKLAREAGLAPTTLLRQRYESWAWGPKLETLQKLSDYTGEPIPPQLIGPQQPALLGFGAPELLALEPDPADDRPLNVSHWTVNTDALSAAGIFRGDDIWFDANLRPETEDVVVANVYKGHDAETVMRIWMPPYLIAAEKGAPTITPVDVEAPSAKAVILGTMIEVRRKRAARARQAA
jgi:transcriptional regulator with XRE-family HTH domain